jgi:hypothetical protein
MRVLMFQSVTVTVILTWFVHIVTKTYKSQYVKKMVKFHCVDVK